MEKHETFYYSHQVDNRGLKTPDQLIRNFESRIQLYDEMIGDNLPASQKLPCVSVACGFGNFMYYLKKKGYRNVAGFDLDPRQIELARSLGLDASVGDALEELERCPGLGAIDALDFIEHLEKDTVVRFLSLALRQLLPGGNLYIQCPCADGFTGAHDLCNDFTHKWAGTSTMLYTLLTSVGFADIELVDPSLPPHPTTIKRKFKFAIRRFSRYLTIGVLKILGVKSPRIWSNSIFISAKKPNIKQSQSRLT